MKIASDRPSVLALATDVVDRDIFSLIEIDQTTPFPLVPPPDRIVTGGQSQIIVRRSSCLVSAFLRVVNGGAGSQTLILFGKGLWRVAGTIVLTTNFAATNINQGIDLNLTVQQLTGPFLSMQPSILGPQNLTFSYDFLFSDDTSFIAAQIGTNGVGQETAVSVNMVCSKYY